MKYIQIEPEIQKKIQKELACYQNLSSIINDLASAGATILLVGGTVRDVLIGWPIKDLDIEVHGIALAMLEEILSQYGPVDSVGKAYGVLRLHGLNIDWSVPRSDASGRKPVVHIDPTMSFNKAFERRDLTINAMGINLSTFELIDPFNGYDDLKKGILRAPNLELFVEDPLRFFRVMQFIGRFNMKPDENLNTVCAKMSLDTISKDRIEGEFEKLLLRSKKPSLGIEWLNTIGRLEELLPELAATKNVPQNPTWHPEGDVYEHTKQALDAAALLEYKDEREKLIGMYAALCHDLGKAVVTTYTFDKGYKSIGHELASGPLTKKLLNRITNKKEIIEDVCTLVINHMAPLQFIKSKAKLPAYKRLAYKLRPLSLRMLSNLLTADRLGRNPARNAPLQGTVGDVELFIEKAKQAGVFEGAEKPLLQGKDIADLVSPGPEMGALLKRAYQLQIAENITDKETLKKRLTSPAGLR